jgi:hypothetical protein
MRVLRWLCEEKGCFRQLCPKLGEFDDCFPGRIGMSDIDGVVEISGRFLLLEWKSAGGSVQTGQRIMFERLTALSHKITVIVVSGDPREMLIQSVQVFHNGKSGPAELSDMDGLKARIKQWSDRARNVRIRPSQQNTGGELSTADR